MATSSRQRAKTWIKKRVDKVTVLFGAASNTNAEVIVEVLENDDSILDFQSSLKQRKENSIITITLPLSTCKSTSSSEVLMARTKELFKYMMDNFKSTVAFSIDTVKTWNKSKLCEALVRTLIESDIDQPEVHLFICTREEHIFEIAVKVCKKKLASWDVSNSEDVRGYSDDKNKPMASLSSERHSWRKDRIETVTVLFGIPNNINPEVIVEVFETSDDTLGLVSSLKQMGENTILAVKLPLPIFKDASSLELLRKQTEKVSKYITDNFKSTIAISMDKVKSWTKLQLCEVFVETLVKKSISKDLSGVHLFICTLEEHIFDTAVIVCKQMLASWNVDVSNSEGTKDDASCDTVKSNTMRRTSKYDDSINKNTATTGNLYSLHLDLKQSNFDMLKVKKAVQTINQKGDVRCEINSGEHILTFRSSSKDNAEDAKAEVVSLLLPPRNRASQTEEIFSTNQMIQVKLRVANILDLPVDCIVNAANTNLDHAGGIAKSIADKAGIELKEECSRYLKENGKLQVGDVLKTTAGKLKNRFVLHTVGPCWEYYKPYGKTEVQSCERDLYCAVLNSLNDAAGCASIALPTISSGKFGVPKEICAVQYAQAILDYSSMETSTLKEIYIVDLNPETIEVIKSAFREMIPKGKLPAFYKPHNYEEKQHRTMHTNTVHQKNYLDVNRRGSESRRQSENRTNIQVVYPYIHEERPPGRTLKVYTCCFSDKQKLYVYTDNILNLNGVDVILCGNNGKGNKGKLSEALSRLCGPIYESDKRKAFNSKRKSGDIIFLRSGNLETFKFVAHAVFTGYTKSKDKYKHANHVFEQIFDSVHKNGCHSMALPLIGTNTGSGDPYFIADRLVDRLFEFCLYYKKFEVNIHLVHIEEDKTQTAKAAISAFIQKAPNRTSSRTLQAPESERNLNSRSWQDYRKDINAEPAFSDSLSNSRSTVRRDSQKTRSISRLDVNTHQTKDSSGDTASYMFPRRDKNGNEETQLKDTIEASKVSTPKEQNEEEEVCVICMDSLKKPKRLPCDHVFCRACINEHFKYKPVCPTCGQVCGIIKGNQPDGTMDVNINTKEHCAGFEKCGRIEITYRFAPGRQGKTHPNPGTPYKGIVRTAFLPNNKRGLEICEMLRVAFDRKLVFTIGRSRTTGTDGVITWNDLHHKTDPKPNTQFGYPDPTYLDRVTDELKIKGVTMNDIPSLSASTRKK